MKLASQTGLKFLDETRRGRIDLIEDYEITPWACAYAALHRFGYPNNPIPRGKQSTFSYIFDTPYDGLYLELSDFKAYVTVHLVYSDAAGDEMAQQHRDELYERAMQLIENLRQPVEHFGTLFDPMTCTFTD